MRNLLIVDVETTGLDPRNAQVVEAAAILYSVEHQTTLAQVSFLEFAESNPCEGINRVPSAAVREVDNDGPLHNAALQLFKYMHHSADAIVAHNAEFDRAFLPTLDRPWICTCHDFQWPNATRDGSSLVSIALAHGVGVLSAHRALTDCQIIAALFDRMDDLPGMLERAMRPKGIWQALVSYDDREQAKAAGFRWDGTAKTWTRRMADDDAVALPFRTRKLSEC